MKSLAIIFIAFASASAFANPASVQALRSELQGKTLVCQSTNPNLRKDSVWRGDDGFFSLALVKGAAEIDNNGGQGYGFGNGYVQDVIVSARKLYVTAGDDGNQTLMFDFSNVGGDAALPKNCAMAALVSQPDLGNYSANKLECCLQ